MTLNTSSAPVASLTATIDATTLSAGTHTVSVQSTDALGNVGAPATISLIVDKTGPATSGVAAAPNPNNGTLGVNSSTPAVRVTATRPTPPRRSQAAKGSSTRWAQTAPASRSRPATAASTA